MTTASTTLTFHSQWHFLSIDYWHLELYSSVYCSICH